MENNFLNRSIEKSRESLELGNFPAGAVVMKGGQVLAESVSSPYPSLHHADSKAIMEAYQKHGSLTGAELYVGLECCLMCVSTAYWAGIRDIYYAVPKSKVSGDYYETHSDTSQLPSEFNEPINLHHIPELEDEALAVIRDWESRRKGVE